MEVSVQDSFKNKYGINAIKEALHQLSRAKPRKANLSWIVLDIQTKSDTALTDTTYLKSLFNYYLGASTDNYQRHIKLIEDSRFFSFSALRLNTNDSSIDSPDITSSQLENLAYSLAHRHTDHYKPNSSQFQEHVFMPYENIAYGMSTEGGSVVINTIYKDDSDEVVHNSNFIRDSLKKAYWPMLLLSYMEFRHLVYLTSNVAPYHQNLGSDKTVIEGLEKQREKILQFRLYYRYSQASQINNHNQFYAKWREAFGSDRLSQELSDDITQINSLLNYKADRHDQLANEKQNRIFTVVGIFATTILSVVGLFGTNFAEFNNEQLTLTSDFTIYVMAAGIGIAIVLCICYYLITKYLKK
ncbi:hypothetical protein [Psychrobacter raelei]|uniref:hypothetical protein n=1 Tax=Psychrobacter raelei TaxID=2565531 RepID=UPI003F5FEFD3